MLAFIPIASSRTGGVKSLVRKSTDTLEQSNVDVISILNFTFISGIDIIILTQRMSDIHQAIDNKYFIVLYDKLNSDKVIQV